MIDSQTYCIRTGLYGAKCTSSKRVRGKYGTADQPYRSGSATGYVLSNNTSPSHCPLVVVYFILILYLMLLFTCGLLGVLQGFVHAVGNCMYYLFLFWFTGFYPNSHSHHHNAHKPHLTQTHSHHSLPTSLSHPNTHIIISSLFYLILIIYIALDMLIECKTTLDLRRSTSGPGIRADISNIPLGTPLIFLLSVVLNQIRLKHKNKNLDSKQYISLVFKHIRFKYSSNSIQSYKIFRKFIIWLSAYNLILLTLCNMSGIINPGPSGLSVAYQNVQGLIPFPELHNKNPTLNHTKMSELHKFAYKDSPDVLVLNETWLKPSIHDNEILSPNAYKIFRRDRSPKSHPFDPNHPKKFRKNGGGVLIAVKTDLQVSSKLIKLNCLAEVLSIELKFPNNTKICISTVYRVSKLKAQNYEALDLYFTTLIKTKKYSKLYIVGDFNFPDLTPTNWETGLTDSLLEQSFITLFSNLDLTQCIKEPTHIKGNTLDLLLTNNTHSLSDILVKPEQSICDSDHFLITFSINSITKRKKSAKRKIPNFKKANWDELNNELSDINWTSLLSSHNIETCWSIFKSKLNEICDKHIPKLTIKSDFQPPWFDSEVFVKCREKEKWRTKFKRSKSLNHELKFKNARREYCKLVKNKMRANFSDDQSDNTITKKFWSHVKSTSNSHRIPELVGYSGTYRSSHIDQANLFNNFFSDQFSCPSSYDINIDYSNNNFDIDFDANDIHNYLRNLDPNKAPGPDQIHGKVLKNCAKSLALPLQILFRTSYYTCIIPEDWKLANVVPVYKKGSKNSVENYRPISLTSLIMKVYERIIRAELMKRIESKLDPRQHGFLPKRSCETQLISFYDNLACSINKGSCTDVVYFDFAKAFDSVNHDKILHKLKHQFGIDGMLLKFLTEYLSNRFQRVVIENTQSTTMPVLSGVPQGSIIGPLLFVIFINDIGNDISEDSNIALYADDTKLYREINCDRDNELLQQDIDQLNNWATNNLMRFHPDKCKVLSVTLQRGSNNSKLLEALPFSKFMYRLGNVPLEFVNSEKDLGVHINRSLTWTDHCNYLYSKASRNLGLLRRTCHFVTNTRQRRNLYLALVRSQFEHCSSVWSPSSKVSLEKLEAIQRRCVKWVLGEDFYSYTSDTYYKKLKLLDLLPIHSRLQLKDLKLLYNIIHNNSIISLPNHVHFHTGVSRLRHCHLDERSLISDIKPKISNNYSKSKEITSSSLQQFTNSYFYRTINYWNALPRNIRDITPASKFETALVAHLWRMAGPVD